MKTNKLLWVIFAIGLPFDLVDVKHVKYKPIGYGWRQVRRTHASTLFMYRFQFKIKCRTAVQLNARTEKPCNDGMISNRSSRDSLTQN